MLDKKDYIIEISKLSIGNNEFEFEINKDLFEFFECEDVNNVKVKVSINVYKSERLMELNFFFKGTIDVNCSRCLDNMSLDINKKTKLYVKLAQDYSGKQPEEIDINEWVMDDRENDLDLKNYLYEELRLMIPLAPTHRKKSDCNQEMLSKLSLFSGDSNKDKEEIDPRWEKLKGLIKN